MTSSLQVIHDGHWVAAAEHSACQWDGDKAFHPWVVLVTGLNGIRKTTSVHQPWFKQALANALGGNAMPYAGTTETLPTGTNSFFRQLDYMIATVANEEFRSLYLQTAGEAGDLAVYSEIKAGIFARYRTLAEMIGILLLKAARRLRMNVMLETSGKDIASFRYVEHLFPEASGYHKLVVHFEINDIRFAETSVDTRMAREMVEGRAAVEDGSTRRIIAANAGGPYGSQVLAAVQADSERVWAAVVNGAAVDGTWLKASLNVTAVADGAWTVQARGSDGALVGEPFVFGQGP